MKMIGLCLIGAGFGMLFNKHSSFPKGLGLFILIIGIVLLVAP